MTKTIQILLADDDEDDCFLFTAALNEIKVPVQLITVRNGEQLLQLLDQCDSLPQVLFLDLNMPRKNGWECLKEIKQNEKFKKLNVVIFSTSFQQEMADRLHDSGAMHYIRKPSDFVRLKEVLMQVLLIIANEIEPPVTLNVNRSTPLSYILSR
ncbi:MAG: response regulator [Cyclobacteriaceae bacterium]|jgi:CheY-like chemotaxis protein|nr:response regulator [Flammeovirgaceae bacterium]